MIDDDDPRLYLDPDTNEHWPMERQYLRHDTAEAVAQLRRGCIHPRRGRVTLDQFVAYLASHDDEHLDQLQRALEGHP